MHLKTLARASVVLRQFSMRVCLPFSPVRPGIPWIPVTKTNDVLDTISSYCLLTSYKCCRFMFTPRRYLQPFVVLRDKNESIKLSIGGGGGRYAFPSSERFSLFWIKVITNDQFLITS